jgi:hypothetical protein
MSLNLPTLAQGSYEAIELDHQGENKDTESDMNQSSEEEDSEFNSIPDKLIQYKSWVWHYGKLSFQLRNNTCGLFNVF